MSQVYFITSGLALSPDYAYGHRTRRRLFLEIFEAYIGCGRVSNTSSDTSTRNTAAQIELLLGVDASDSVSSKGRPETPGVIAGVNPDNEAYSPDTDANADVPPTNLSTPRSCAPDDFVCADGTCIPETHHCDHFYDCRDFTDEQYCFG